MTDVPPGQRRPADDSESWEPTGARRSTYTPPPAGVEPPDFDDDALADALAAQVASYTSPIPVMRPATEPLATVAPAAESPASATDAPVGPSPALPSTGDSDAPGSAEAPDAVDASDAPDAADVPDVPAAEEASPASEPGVSPTLEAIERLENELRRRAEEAGIDLDAVSAAEPEAAPPPAPDEPTAGPGHDPFPPSGALFPAPPTYLRAAPPEEPAFEAEPEVEAEAEAEAESPSVPDAAPETDAAPESDAAPEVAAASEPVPYVDAEPAPVFPFSPPTGAIPVVPTTPQPVAVSPSWLTEPPSSAPIDLPEPPGAEAPPESATPESEPFGPEPAIPEPVASEPAVPEPLAPEPFTPESFAPAPASEASSAVPGPPPLVEPPAFATPPTGSEPFAPPASAASLADPPATPPVDLPPPTPGAIDFAHLPPPIGLEPAPLPPYDPTAESPAVPPPHPDDLGFPAPAPSPFAPPPAAPAFAAPAPGALPFDLPAAPSGSDLAPLADEDDDAVDATDRVAGSGAIPVDPAEAATTAAPLSQPVPTARRDEDEPGLLDRDPEHQPALTVESAGPEPTALDVRAGRAARLFWLWFAANSSVISLSLGAVLFGLGMSLRQALVAVLLGVALSFLPLGLVTLAGKWSGQPTMIVSRATFGVVGNVLPAVIAVLSRVFWGGALLWMLASGVGRVLGDAGLDAGLGEQTWTFVALGVGAVLVVVVAVFGYGLIARVQLVLSILTGVLVVGVIALTFPHLDIAAAQRIDDGPWTLLLGGAVLVFSFVGLAWVHSSADVARYQRPDSDGGSTMLWATFGATLPAFVLVAWGALLAASDPVIADGLVTNPLHTIAALLPVWYPVPLLAALGLGLLSGAVLTVYSGGFALQSLGVPLRRSGTTLIAGGLVVLAGVLLVLVAGDARGLIRDVATTVGVPVAAWAGIFATEMMIRRRRLHADSLLRRGGVYADVRWANLVGLVVISALGFGLTSAVLPGLDWQGYLLPLLGLAADDPLLTSDVGVLVALALGILLPLATAVPGIRRQERASVD